MSSLPPPPTTRWQRLSAASVRGFHAYANWLVGITWRRFFVLAVLLMIATSVLQNLPPFSWTTTEILTHTPGEHEMPRPPKPPRPPEPPQPPEPPSIRIDKPGAAASASKGVDISISIDENGVRIVPRKRAAPAGAEGAASAASAPASGASLPSVDIKLPPGAGSAEVLAAIAEAQREISAAVADMERDAAEAAREALAEAREEIEVARAEAAQARGGKTYRTSTVSVGAFLTNLALLFIAASAILKITYKGRVQAEVKAAEATQTAEAESLKRQVVEARMAAMQAQVEPHFLFNTLASIDHLIETDPRRASQMQKNLIALLRAAMPTMREANGEAGSVRDLGRELAVIRPYLEILKVRMEERLATEVRVPEGLNSAEFPPMMLQSLVENAIKHGLEPKPEGGSLTVSAEIVHGKLAVTVADTGLGFGKAATAGTGIGLSNIRERLALLYGNKATLTVAENQPSGTVVTITVPYTARPLDGEAA